MAGETGATTDRLLNKLQYALANKAATGTALASGDLIPVADVSADYKIVGATASEIAAGARPLVSIPDATAYVVLAANSGKVHVIPNLTADCTIDLPTPEAGLEYTFITNAVATEGQNWIFDTKSATNYYTGGLQFLDSDEPGSGSTLVPVYPDGNSNDIMTIITPQAGTRVHVICDGTLWIVNGVVFSATAPTFAD